MSTMIAAPALGSKRAVATPVDVLLRWASDGLMASMLRGAVPARIDAAGFLARYARRLHGNDRAAAARTLALALGRLGCTRGTVTTRLLADRLHHVQRSRTGGQTS
ncbi:hypothetical protein DTL70_21085 [Streptomyces diacarni]|uniref:Uncharacterized protein n=1 Tax=Streptomyces diacarni TaxID=2800381 RepID=A0A367ERW0_9ACTN|nr:hypothetical protein [Streptomyces diacarni]RCG20771.1 hypothetical protein DTL70_21085 [Streptomyces diacarni]